MKKFSKILYVIIFAFILILLTGCESKPKEELIANKTFSEIEYIESKVLVIVKKYFLSEYSNDNNEVQWNLIENDFAGVVQNSNVMIIDLADLSADNTLIMDLENKISNVSSAIKSQTESNFLGSLREIYMTTLQLIDKYYDDKNVVREKFVKGDLLDSLYFYIIGDYESAKNSINNADTRYLELVNDKEYLENNSYKVNRNYVAIQELKLAIEKQELTTVIQKYMNTLNI